MEARQRTWFDERGLVIAVDGGTRALPFYAGTVHYWRIPPVRWGAALRALHASGLTLVETFVPWRVHAPESGTHVWTGERDLARFLDAARAAGLSVVLRIGPQANAELPNLGLPDWVVADEAVQARTAQDTVAWLPLPPHAFPIPSYASTKFHAHVRTWYAALADAIRPHLAPEGPVVALGVDNEAHHFFRSGAFDLDYHPDALAWWRDASGLDEPPREYHTSDAARCALWLKFKDEYTARALSTFTHILGEVGLGDVARLHALAPGHYQHADARQLAHAIHGPVGIGAYAARAELASVRRCAATLATATPPLATEVSTGFLPWLPPLDEADDPTRARDQLLSLLAGGVRGFNLFSSTPLDQPWVKPLLAALAEVEWTTLHRHTPIALVDTRADHRFGLLTSLVDPVTPLLADALSLGPGGAAELGTDSAAISSRRWQHAIARALELAQVPYAIIDEATAEEDLARFKAIIAPTFDRIDHGLYTRLRAIVEHKRAIVVLGPGSPTRDELDQPLTDALPKRIGKLKPASLDDLPGLAEDLAALAGELPEAWQIERPDDVRAFAFANAEHHVRVVIVASDSPKATSAVLLADGHTLRDPIARETLRIDEGRATIPLPPYGVRFFIVDATRLAAV